jgi:CBS domain-containing protein/Kef-type K+ transport system membrane component KefB
VGASVVAGGLGFAVTYFGTGRAAFSAAVGIIIGSVASATAPAATVDVLSEYRARGPLTTTTLAVVALDDVFAVGLFSIGLSVAAGLLGSTVSLSGALWGPLRELGISTIVGGSFGFVLAYGLKRVAEKEAELVMIIGTVLLAIGLSFSLGAEPILTSMVLGFTVANLAPAASGEALEITERFAGPVYVLFFVMAGARLEVAGLKGWMWLLAGAYILGRLLGKILGAGLSASLSGADEVIRKYLGLCLASQAGVAVGLSIMAGMRLKKQVGPVGDEIGQIVIAVVASTVFFFEIVGPALVKVAVQKSGEAGRNVTEEDLIRSRSVADVMNGSPATFHRNTNLHDILRGFSANDSQAFPVVDDDKKLVGLVTAEEIRESLAAEGLQEMLVADDLMSEAKFRVHADVPLQKALDAMYKAEVAVAPVVAEDDKRKLVGMLEAVAVRREIVAELLRLQAVERHVHPTVTTVITKD